MLSAADDELPVVLGRLSAAFDCIGNLKSLLMRCKVRERGLLGVPEDHRGSSETTKLLFEAVASAVSLCALGTERNSRNSSQPGRRCQLKGNTSSTRAMRAGYQTRSTRSTATPASSIPSCCCCSSSPSSSGLL